MIDLHAHFLVGWDDGPSSLADAIEMLRIAKEEGIEKIVITPHLYRLNKYHDNLEIMKERFFQIVEEAKHFAIEFYLSPEIYVHPEMLTVIKKEVCINNGSYIFIEFPSTHIPPGWRNLVFEITLRGFVPIICHPERNDGIRENPSILYEMIKEGVLSMGTAMSLTGEFGSLVKKTITHLLSHNLITFIASDAHDPKERPPRLRKAVDEASKIVGQDYALAMVTKIPQAILEDKAIETPEPIRPKKGT